MKPVARPAAGWPNGLSRWMTLGLGLPLLVVLGACQAPLPDPVARELRFDDLPPLRFDVAEVVIEQAYRSPLRPPNVEELFPVRPADAAVQWARDRIVAAGATRTLRFVVREASAIEEPLKVQGGIKGAFILEQATLTRTRIVIEAEIIDRGISQARARAEAERTATTPEKISPGERERAWFALTRDLMRDLNAQLEKTLGQVFQKYRLP